MNIEEMNLEQVEERLSQLVEEVEKATEVDVIEKATEEKRSLIERKDELQKLEERRATAEALNNGTEESKTIETGKEEKTMEERKFTVDSVEYRDAYLKSLMGKGIDVEERAALTDAQYIIPTQTVNKIYGKLEENPLIAEVDALHVPGYLSVPKATTVNDASWVAIGTDSTDSQDAVGAVSLTAKKLIKTIEITADIQAMSIPAFEGWLVNKLAQKMEAAICAAIINGAGSSTVPTGILKDRTADETSVTTVAKLSKLMGDLGGAYHNGAVWVMASDVFYGTIVPLCSDKNGIFVMNGMEKVLLGHKVIIDDTCNVTVSGTTTKNIIFGNLKAGYVFNFGEGIAIEADQSVAFRSGSTVYRAMALCDGAPADDEAFVLGTV